MDDGMKFVLLLLGMALFSFAMWKFFITAPVRLEPKKERLLSPWEVAEIEHECEVGQVTTMDVLNAMTAELDREGLPYEEQRRISDAAYRFSTDLHILRDYQRGHRPRPALPSTARMERR